MTEWDDKMTNTIPPMLRVHLVLGINTARGENAPDFAATRIYAVPSQMMPANIQRGTVPGAQNTPNNLPFPTNTRQPPPNTRPPPPGPRF
jgi:hypothetical protein